MLLDRSRAASSPGAAPDAELLDRARQGDTAAQEALYRRYVSLVSRVLRQLLPSAQDLEDALQQTFVVALEKLDDVRQPEHFRAWLLRIAVRTARRGYWVSRVTSWFRLSQQIEGDGAQYGVATGLEANERAQWAIVTQRLKAVPRKTSEPFLLHVGFGFTLEETACVLNISLATTKRRIAEAKQQLEAPRAPR